MRGRLSERLSELPLILRCAVVGWVCVGAILVPVIAALDISEYSLANVIQATLFGVFESSVVAAVVGGGLGLLVGVLAYLSGRAVRAARRRGASG